VGLRGTGLGELVFEQVQLSPEQVLGEAQQIGQGKAQAEYLTALNQISGAAIGLGIAQSAYLYSLNYARERSQFGQTLLQFEAVDHMLVDMAVGIKSTHWLLYHACWLADQGKPFALEAAMTRLQAGNLARQAGLQSVHILGGYGYMAEYDAQRSMRDALVLFPGSESAEILKTKIGKQLHEHT
jgi:alkylation response protein AidB-like acyl-CoA dehydrogenase